MMRTLGLRIGIYLFVGAMCSLFKALDPLEDHVSTRTACCCHDVRRKRSCLESSFSRSCKKDSIDSYRSHEKNWSAELPHHRPKSLGLQVEKQHLFCGPKSANGPIWGHWSPKNMEAWTRGCPEQCLERGPQGSSREDHSLFP